jgi:RNA polymerase sigma factor (sigma-70 family)
MEKDTTYINFEPGSDEMVHKLVEDHQGWAASIARSVARAWNLDWQLDGIDGGAYEGLLFCAQRYDPEKGVPFRAYARRRIHEASTQQARESKAWQRGTGAGTEVESDAREISARLLDIYAELRDGLLPTAGSDVEGEEAIRASIRQLLTSANLLSSFNESRNQNPEYAVEFKRMLSLIVEMETVHQHILWNVYWQGQSMRSLASDWGIDELAVIREHQAILKNIQSRATSSSPRAKKKLKIRPGLRPIAQKMRKEGTASPFAEIGEGIAAALVLLAIQVMAQLSNLMLG